MYSSNTTGYTVILFTQSPYTASDITNNIRGCDHIRSHQCDGEINGIYV